MSVLPSLNGAQENGLIFNLQKGQAIFISPYARKKFTALSVLTSGATCILIVPDVRVLGITIIQDFKWATHATRTQKSVAKMLDILNRFGSALNTSYRILQAFILLNYHIAHLYGAELATLL